MPQVENGGRGWKMIDAWLEILRHHRVLEPIDVHFASFLGGLADSAGSDVVLAAALASRASGEGHICLDLAAVSDSILLPEEGGRPAIGCPGLNHWERRLRGSTAVGRPGDRRPLILDDHHRLYLYRYWRYENELSAFIRGRIRSDRTAEGVDRERLRSGLKRLFPSPVNEGADRQKLAALVAVLKSFCVITGGPGTGKTSTVAAILALLLEQVPVGKQRIFLAAPTGKAAARLGEALRSARNELPVAESLRSQLPTEAVTIHRLLRPIPGTPFFRHNASNRLAADTVIVDEASMVDLALLAKLVQALDESTRLVLIGDKDQLASVEAGAVLGDLCDRDRRHGYSADLCRMAAEFTGEKLAPGNGGKTEGGGLGDCIVELRRSFRFSPDGGIGALSRLVNQGDVPRALDLLGNDSEPAVRWMPMSSATELRRQLSEAISDDIGRYRTARDPRQALEAFGRFGLLCAVNRGPCGVHAVNRLAEQLLSKDGLIPPVHPSGDPWYDGRPVMITRNDYHLDLFNGDIGIALPAEDPQEPGSSRLAVCFPEAGDRGWRQIPAYRLSDHQTVYAMTVHKSQGSEFDTVHLVLPERESPVLSRELVYTAITRARKAVVIWGPQPVLTAAIRRPIVRSSGLRDALWGR